MAALSAFYPWVSIACPGVPNPVMDDAIRRACREFSKATRSITSDVSLPTVASTQDYAPALATGTELVSVVSLKRSATESLPQRTQEYIDAHDASSGDAIEFCVLETNPLSLRLRPTPDSIETLTLKVALMPLDDATTVDSRLFDWHVEGVTAYAKYLLQNQVDKPWSNPDAAKFSFRQFETQSSAVIIRRNQGYGTVPMSVEMRPFA